MSTVHVFLNHRKADYPDKSYYLIINVKMNHNHQMSIIVYETGARCAYKYRMTTTKLVTSVPNAF